MADIVKAMSLISGGEVTPQQVQRVQALAHALDIPNSDPMLPILIALDAYHGAFSTMPQDAIKQAADLLTRILANFKATADAQANASAMGVQKLLADEVGKAATSLATIQQERQLERDRTTMARWALSAFGVAAVAICGAIWFGHNWGYDAGKSEATTVAAWMTTAPGQAAYKAFLDDPVAAEWAGTRAARVAYKLSKTDDLVAIAECDRPGWVKETQMDGRKLCLPRSTKKNELYGWVVP